MATKKREPKEFYYELQEKVSAMREDVDKFIEKGNKSSGRRLRKALQEIKKAIKPWRDEIQAMIVKM